MNVEKVRKARRDMEIAIRQAVERAMSQFREQTGMSPHGVTIYLADVTEIGDRERHYVVEDVRAAVDI